MARPRHPLVGKIATRRHAPSAACADVAVGRADAGPAAQTLGVASDIELLIFDGTTTPPGLPADASTVRLSAVLSGIPVTPALVASLTADAADRDAIHPGWMLRASVSGLAQRLSADRWVLYVAAETFAGPGAQEAVGWHHGAVAYGPAGTCDVPADLADGYRVAPRSDSAINVGLRLMGIHASDGLDEFAAAGLSAHRFTADWHAQ
jgi:hypothetical protein